MAWKITTAVLLTLGAVLAVYAGDLNGRWEGKMVGPDGDEFALVFNFKTDGDNLSGSVEGPAGELPISDGKVKGDEFSFKVKFEENVIDHQGKVVGDTINMKVQGPWGESEMSLKRAPNK